MAMFVDDYCIVETNTLLCATLLEPCTDPEHEHEHDGPKGWAIALWLAAGPHTPYHALVVYPTRPLRDAAFEALGAMVRQAEADEAYELNDDDA